MRNKKNLVGVIIALLILFASIAPTPTSTQAAPNASTFTTEQTRWAGTGQVRVNGGFTFSNSRVYSSWRDCRVLWSGYGTRIDITWCGAWNNGSNNYMEIGANYTVRYLLPNGQEYYRYDGWMRTRVYPSGRVEFYP